MSCYDRVREMVDSAYFQRDGSSGTVVRARSVRGSVILSSQRSLRDAGLFERYLGALPEACRSHLLAALATQWLDIDLAVAHYQACDRLNLNKADIETIARDAGGQINTIYVRGMLRLAPDVTPRLGWLHSQRIWSRVWNGSVLHVSDVGPKDVKVDVLGHPCLDIPYFRHALGTFFACNTELFCRRAYVKQAPGPHSPEAATYLVSWV